MANIKDSCILLSVCISIDLIKIKGRIYFNASFVFSTIYKLGDFANDFFVQIFLINCRYIFKFKEMDGISLVLRYEQEAAAIVDALIVEFKRKYPDSKCGDRNSTRYMFNNRSLEFKLQSLAVNMMDEYMGDREKKGKIWDSLTKINHVQLIRFKDHFYKKSKITKQ